MDPQRMISGDSTLVEKIVNYLKSKGIFDEFRHECLADVDTKSSCQNLSQRVDGYAAKFLASETWHPDLNKNELRNKLRRHIDESGMLAVGADHVVEQVINPKIHQLFLPKIIEVVHQYMKEQNELLNKKPETSISDNTTSENVSDAPDSNKGKTSALDPIADILSFSSLKSKASSASSTPSKTDNVLPKLTDVSKTEKKKEEKSIPVSEKNALESPSETVVTPTASEGRSQIDKEKVKKEEPESSPEISKKSMKDESKQEKKKSEDAKPQTVDTNAEENKPSTSVSTKPIVSGRKDAEESKANTPVPAKPSSTVKKDVEEGKSSASASSKPSSSSKKDVDKSKLKSKSSSIHKTSTSTSAEVKKPKKESSDKNSDKPVKSKSSKPSKDLSSPSKSVSSTKNASKEEKSGEISKSRSSDSNSSKTSESSVKKPSKSSSSKKDHISSKHKSHSEKTEKYKASKTSDKNEQNITESPSSCEKGNKNVQYSSSYDSSQGSDQDKSSSSSINKDRQKHFSKHVKKESSEKSLNKSSDTSSQKRKVKDADESPTKKLKNETNSTQEKFKESITLGEAAKISSRSNSFGSTSSVSSSSNTSKDNVISNSDETSESGGKDKKKKRPKDKEPCHNLKTLPPPPPPPPPSSSLSCELTSADASSVEDTQSSSDREHSSSDESSDESSSDAESEFKESALNTLNETLLNNSSSDDINEFYDIFLYSSSSSEFEGFGDSPEKLAQPDKINESDVSVSSVHTSDLSSFDDEISDDDFFINNESQPGTKKRLTLKEAEKLLKSKAFSQSFHKSKSTPVKNKLDDVSSNKTFIQNSSHLSSEDESSPSEPKRSLRRERKLNPRYASSEYTSIFNSRKETFITKQSSPYVKNQAPNSSPKLESKHKKEPNVDTDKSLKKNSLTLTKTDAVPQDKAERSQRAKRKSSATVEEDKIFSDNSKMSNCSDELDSFIDKEKLFHENDKSCPISGSEQFKRHFQFKSQNNSNFNVHSYPVKRKLSDVEVAAPAKRPCSRASVDSTSSDFVPNENKPFNSEKHSSSDEKVTKSSDFKGSDLTDTIKKDMFCKQRTNNNGDVLGQKDIFSKPPRGKVVNASEKKPNETEKSKELNVL